MRDGAGWLFIISNIDLDQLRGAPFARMRAYAQALRELGVSTCLASLNHPRYLDAPPIEVEPGLFLLGQRRKSPGRVGRWARRLGWRFGALGTLRRLRRRVAGFPGPRAILVYPSFHDALLEAACLVSMRGIPGVRVISEENEGEWALAASQPLPARRWPRWLAMLRRPFRLAWARWADGLGRLADGVVAISTRLEAGQRRLGARVVRIPILAHVGDGVAAPPPRGGPLVLGFFGGLLQGKEGLEDLLQALSRQDSRDWRLLVHGVGTARDRERLRRLGETLGLGSQVDWREALPHRDVPQAMAATHVLVLPRPSTPQTEAGFSTKLAEYLASGRPVLSTRVSDIGLYLADGENGFLAEPGSVEDLERQLRRILGLPREDLHAIGMRGRETARAEFAPRIHATALHQLFFGS